MQKNIVNAMQVDENVEKVAIVQDAKTVHDWINIFFDKFKKMEWKKLQIFLIFFNKYGSTII